MNGLNVPSTSGDAFISILISVTGAITVALLMKSFDNKNAASNAFGFWARTVLFFAALMFIYYNLIGIAITYRALAIEEDSGCVDAFPVFKNGMRWNPKHEGTRWGLVRCGGETNRLDEAIKMMEEVQPILEDYPIYWEQLAWGYNLAKSFDKMISAVAYGAKLNPNDVSWLTPLGTNLYNQRFYPEAENVFRVERSYNGDDGQTAYWLGWTLLAEGEYQDALNHFDLCLSQNQDHYEQTRCISGKAYAYYYLGNASEAKVLFETSLRIYPDQQDVTNTLSQIP